MSLITQKFGGSSVANTDRLRDAADIVTKTYSQSNDVVVVVSVQSDTTDDLVAKAKEVNPHPSRREMDVLPTAGEQMSASPPAMTIKWMGFPVVSLLSWQAGFLIDTSYGSARIKHVIPDHIKKEPDKHNIAIITGLQGANRYNDMTTPRCGSSDTNTVAIATIMHADLCQIYTDMEGAYTADPHKIKNAKKIDVISYNETLELATFDAQVLNNRSVEAAKRYNVELEVLSSYNRVSGMIVRRATKIGKMLVSGTAKDDGVARVTIIGASDRLGLALKVFSKLSARNMNISIILQSVGRNGTKDISFTVSEDHLQATMEAPTSHVEQTGISSIVYDEDVAKASIVGVDMETHLDVATMTFEALFESDANIQMISISEIKISVPIECKDADRAVTAIHNKFFPEVVDQ